MDCSLNILLKLGIKIIYFNVETGVKLYFRLVLYVWIRNTEYQSIQEKNVDIRRLRMGAEGNIRRKQNTAWR